MGCILRTCRPVHDLLPVISRRSRPRRLPVISEMGRIIRGVCWKDLRIIRRLSPAGQTTADALVTDSSVGYLIPAVALSSRAYIQSSRRAL